MSQWGRVTGRSSKFGGGAYNTGGGPFPHGGVDFPVQLDTGDTVAAGQGVRELAGMVRRGQVALMGLQTWTYRMRVLECLNGRWKRGFVRHLDHQGTGPVPDKLRMTGPWELRSGLLGYRWRSPVPYDSGQGGRLEVRGVPWSAGHLGCSGEKSVPCDPGEADRGGSLARSLDQL